MATSYATRTPPPQPRSNSALEAPSPPPTARSPRPETRFDSELLKAYVKKLVATKLQGESWPPPRDRDRTRAWCKEIGERVKERMLEIQPNGFKYVVLTRVDENSGQGGHANLICHWEDSDTVVQEVYTNDSLICVCIAFAIRTA